MTALLIVQVTLVGTITDTARRILSVVAGVALAIVFSAFVGFSWWSLALLIGASIMVGQVLRLGPHLLEVPISAMLVLAVGGLLVDEGEQHPDELAVALDSAREARAMLTDLLLVDPQADPQLWQLHGALLAAVDRVLRELDVEERARQRERQRRAVAEESTRTAIAVERLRSATKAATRSVTEAVTDAVTDLPYRRGARKPHDERDSQP